MTLAMQPLALARAERIYALVSLRLGANAGSPAQDAAANYARLCSRLPALLHHNGLTHTLEYLRFLAGPDPRGRASEAAQHLLADWLDSPTGTAQGWHLQALPGGDQQVQRAQALSEFRLASRLARREADWFKRCAQALVEKTANPQVHLAADPSGPADVAR